MPLNRLQDFLILPFQPYLSIVCHAFCMRLLFFIMIPLFLVSCLKDDLDTSIKITATNVNYLSITQDTSDLTNRPFTIIGVTPDDADWNIILEYAGGCEEHTFLLWWSGIWDTVGLEASFYLFHDSGDDTCESTVRDTLTVSMPDIFGEAIADTAALISLINGYNHREIDIPSELVAGLASSGSCVIPATVTNVSCQWSMWGTRWLLLQDTIGSFEEIWLQPVKNAESVSLIPPVSGSYLTGITPLFGYQFADSLSACTEYPSGVIVPVAVNCIEAL